MFSEGIILGQKKLQKTYGDNYKKFIRDFDVIEEEQKINSIKNFCMDLKHIRFTLTCDFLKELGFAQYGKPDSHIKSIFASLEWVAKESKDEDIFKKIDEIATIVNKTPYYVDKVFWLLASGNFYNERIILTKRDMQIALITLEEERNCKNDNITN